ncbi:MAG: T9SS type A sorting domain-containing protein, partial [Bacteroidetes bacterium]|nr:T9SS type A sorting domain-containing protein [Bacteroidota bacterium]
NSTGVVLSGVLTIDGTLTLGNGHLSLGDNNLIIAASGDIDNAGASGYIIANGNGELWQLNIGSNGRSGAVLYPLGSSTGSYTPLTLGNSATSNSFGLRVLDEVLSEGTTGTPLTSGVVGRTWALSSGGGQCDVSLVFGWSAAEELQGFDRSQCYVTRHEYGTNWGALQQPGATTGSGTLTRIIGGVTSLSTAPTLLSIGSGSTLFPVELLSLDAVIDDGNVHLFWMTSNEVNNFGFRIQRRSQNETTWQNAGFIPAATSGDILHSYHWIDPEMPTTSVEYRLAQVDLDGSIRHSAVLGVAIPVEAGIRLGEVHPQPLLQGQSAGISLSARADTPLRLTLYDALGRRIQQVFDGMMQAGTSRVLVLPTAALHPGSYFLRLESNGTSQIRKFSILR